VNDGAIPFTLREAQAHFQDRRTWIGILLIGALLGLIGPFGTFEHLELVPRLGYWLLVAAVSYSVGTVAGAALFPVISQRVHGIWLQLGLIGLLPGPLIAAVIYLINGLVFGFDGAIAYSHLVVYCALICLGITTASHHLERQISRASAAAPNPQRPAILDRLPRPQQGRLLHIGVTDHYVEVTTEKGTSLLLMRLSDAIGEAAPAKGLQVHRSHWVALDAVRSAKRQDGKPVLELENGAIIPISRSFLAAAKAAGLAL
jgi:hypothetical protein